MYGFSGFRDPGSRLTFRPQRPLEAQSPLKLPLTYRGQVLEVEISPDTTTYSLCQGEELVIGHGEEAVSLTRKNPLAVRPTLQR